MDLLTALGSLGLPGWLMSVAALVIIFHYTGVIKWVGEALRDEQESWQEGREHDKLSQAQRIATQELRNERFESAALEIVRENNRWARDEFSEMLKVMKQQSNLLEQIRNNTLILSGHVAKLTDKVEALTAKGNGRDH